MNGYERRTEQKKSRVRAAALELIRVYGTDKTSIKEIANKAGVSPASIYNYFGSKQGLMKDAIIWSLEERWKANEDLWNSDLPFPELVQRALSTKDSFIDQVDVEYLADPEIKQLIDDYYRRRYPRAVTEFLDKGRREGFIRESISVEAATFYLRMCQEALLRSELLKDENKSLLKELFNLMLYGLAGKPIDE
ncbi:MAG: TetR/AcrR family transcriptional regulator [Firmicutes bacterium]|nr:TetR/AcrR family transcriptional regulator [Bacillota bacterium]